MAVLSATSSLGWWLAWVPFLLYYVATVPQIIKNYTQGSADGLSARMVFCDFVGAISTTIYTFLLWLPFACRFMEPLCAVNIGTLAVQGYWYSKQKKVRRTMIIVYSALLCFSLVMVVIGLRFPRQVGNIMGWISMIIQCFTQLPQVIKNYERSSVQGLSFAYMSLLGVAGVFEMLITLLLGLPWQSFFNGLRGVLYYLVMCVQFYQYRHTVRRWW